jgi:DUF4097 and DUF4098 domain-containing protein YvlB
MGRILKRGTILRPAAAGLMLGGVLCLGITAGYAEQIKKQFPTGSKPSLLLRNQNGSISVKTWDQRQVSIQANSSSDAIEVMILPGEQRVTVQTHPREDRVVPLDAHVDFDIWVPRESTVHVDTERGQVSVENVTGDISIEGVSNPIVLSNLTGHISVRTVDGPIVIRSSEGHIEARSISGDLKFQRVNASELVANTNSGTITYEGDFGSGGRYILNNYRSPINITTSEKASFELTARSMEGSIETDISLRPTPMSNHFRRLSPTKFLQGLFNSGESTVQVMTYSGTIRLHGPR